MTHFVGIVIHDADETLDQLLAPFDETKETPRYMRASRAEVIAAGRKRIAEYATDGPYGQFRADPAGYLKAMIRVDGEERFFTNPGHINYLVSEFPLELEFDDQQVWAKETRFEEPEDVDADGNVYSTYNPESIWDWWVIGGRWSDEYVPGNRMTVGEFRQKVEAGGFDRDLPRVVFDRSGALRLGTEGWWGFTKDDVDEATWRSKVLDRLEPHTDDELVTFIDLHI